MFVYSWFSPFTHEWTLDGSGRLRWGPTCPGNGKVTQVGPDSFSEGTSLTLFSTSELSSDSPGRTLSFYPFTTSSSSFSISEASSRSSDGTYDVSSSETSSTPSSTFPSPFFTRSVHPWSGRLDTDPTDPSLTHVFLFFPFRAHPHVRPLGPPLIQSVCVRTLCRSTGGPG